MNTATKIVVGLALCLAVAVTGCKKEEAKKPQVEEGPSKEDVRRGIGKMLPSVQRFDAGQDLRNIGQLYAACVLGGTPPKKIEDLSGLDARTVKAINEGQYVVLW